MTDIAALKKQRDRFLAFSFASSDLFIEVDEKGKITYAFGAAKGMTGIDDKNLTGQQWYNLFTPDDQTRLKQMQEDSIPGLRGGPLVATLNEDIVAGGKKAIVTSIVMPNNSNFYVTLGVSSLLMSKISGVLNEDTKQPTKKAPPKKAPVAKKEEETNALAEIMDQDNFAYAAQEAISAAKDAGKDVDLTLIDFGPTADDRFRMGEEAWGDLIGDIQSLMLTQSLGGNTAAEVGDGMYSMVHEAGVNSDEIREQIASLAVEHDPTGEGVSIASKTIKGDFDGLNDRNAARALVFTLNEFQKSSTDLSVENLGEGFKNYVAENADRIKQFETIVERLSFSLHFQPIVDLKTNKATHFEMLSRFAEGDTMEWVMFGEDIGMAAEFDLAVCERAINYISSKARGSSNKFSINISGQSIADESFCTKLLNLLSGDDLLPGKIIFEITESSHIQDLEEVNQHIKRIHEAGFHIALDDFGSGSASFEYLQNLDVDYVKIDGKYIRKILHSAKDLAMVKNLTQMCLDLDIKVVAEFVEEEAQVKLLKELGIHYGQGYLFGKPDSKPLFRAPKL